jgi:hypothetical protein
MNRLATTMKFTFAHPGFIAHIHLLDKENKTLDKVILSSTLTGLSWFESIDIRDMRITGIAMRSLVH